MKKIRKDILLIEDVKVFSDKNQNRININKNVKTGNYNIILIPV